MRTLTRIRAKKQQIESIARHYGIRDIRIFGSVARGEETHRSDVDMLVEGNHILTIPELCGVQDELSKLLGKRVQVVEKPELSRYVRDRVLREAVAL
ncbi:MAG: nucleotidyltransferase family protein [Gammaproteobacteria bacterium]|nr:nucleotidyltransferase family protein [Gammaproteobacteria bacterium]